MDDHLERYLELCKRMCERMERDGTWPWADSPNADSQESEDMVESEDNPHDI
jgi:hypothetical protein